MKTPGSLILQPTLFFVASALALPLADAGATSAERTGWREGLYREAREIYDAHAPERARRAAAENPLLAPERRRSSIGDIVMLQAPPVMVDRSTIDEIRRSIERDAARYEASWPDRLLVRPVYEHQFRKVRFGVYSILGVPVLVGLSW